MIRSLSNQDFWKRGHIHYLSSMHVKQIVCLLVHKEFLAWSWFNLLAMSPADDEVWLDYYDFIVNTDSPVVFYEPLPHSAVDPATQYYIFMWAPIGIGTHSSIVSCTMTMCIHVLSPNLILIADARHYNPLIINASQAIRVHTSLKFKPSINLGDSL